MRKVILFFTSSIQRRSLSNLAIVVVLVLVMALAGYLQLNQVRRSLEQALPNTLQMGLLQDFALAVSALDANLERFFVIGGAQFRDYVFQNLADMTDILAAMEENANSEMSSAVTELERATAGLENEILTLLEMDSIGSNAREVNEKVIFVYSEIDRVKQMHQALSEETLTLLQDTTLEQRSTISNVILQFLGLGAVVSAIVVIASLLITRSIATPLVKLAKTASRIAAGDLELAADVKREDEVGALAQAFNSMTKQLRGLIADLQRRMAAEQATVQEYVHYMSEVAQGHLSARLTLSTNGSGEDDPFITLGRQLNETTASLQQMTRQVRDTANSLSSAAAEILTATTQQAVGANEQSVAISQTSSTIDEVRTIAEQTAQRALAVADMAQQVSEVSQSGQQAVADTIQGMAQVKGKVETIATDILALSEQSQAIGQIIASVNEIANQSNMLALNAAVEAARAGEAGRGFAVVAQEVRALAEQSRAATAQVEELLTQIQHGVNAAVMATEEGMKGTDAGMKLAGEAGLAIQRLTRSVTESTQASEQISAAAAQQQAGMEQIAVATENILQVTAQSVTGAQQTERAAGELNDLARQLQELVEQYQA